MECLYIYMAQYMRKSIGVITDDNQLRFKKPSDRSELMHGVQVILKLYIGNAMEIVKMGEKTWRIAVILRSC